MIEALPKTKGDATREKCLRGVKGLIASLSRKLSKISESGESKTIIVEINSASGILSASEAETKQADPLPYGRDPGELFSEILERLDQLALPDCHKLLRIEIVSVKGTLSAIDTEITRYRWDI